jgi:hypothetical protein
MLPRRESPHERTAQPADPLEGTRVSSRADLMTMREEGEL